MYCNCVAACSAGSLVFYCALCEYCRLILYCCAAVIVHCCGRRVLLTSFTPRTFVGLLIGVPILRNLKVQSWERVARWVFLVIYLLFMVAGVLFNALCGGKLCCTSVPFGFGNYRGEKGLGIKFEPAASCETAWFRNWMQMSQLAPSAFKYT